MSLTFSDSNLTDCTNKRCFPRPKTIPSHIIRTIRKLRHSNIYQGCFIKKIVKWEKDLLTPSIHFRAKGKRNNCLMHSYDIFAEA